MQPHSISALAVANYVWGFYYGQKIPRGGSIELDFGRTKISHTISGIEAIGRIPYISVLKIPVRTRNGELCTITIRRKTTGSFKPGEEYVIATHSVQHRSGLEEHYRPDRHHIYGFLRNSEKYGYDYGADVISDGDFTIYYDEKDRETGRLVSRSCKVKFRPNVFLTPENEPQKVESNKRSDSATHWEKKN